MHKKQYLLQQDPLIQALQSFLYQLKSLYLAECTVTWTNDDSTIHTVVEGGPQGGAAGEPAFDSSIIAPKGTWENTFDTAGEFDYYCSLHPFMTGKVTVT